MGEESQLDLKVLLSNVKRNWYYFVCAIVASLLIAFVKIQLSAPVYQARATLLIGDVNSGSRAPGEVLDALEIKDKNIQIEDIIGLLTSYSMVSNAIEKLDFKISYFEIEDHWLNSLGDVFVKERIENFPFNVKLNERYDQLVGVPIFIEKVTNEKFRIRAEAEEGSLFNFDTSQDAGSAFYIAIDEVHSFGEPSISDYFNLTVTVQDEFIKEGSVYYFMINNLNSMATGYQNKLSVQPISRESRILELVSQGKMLKKETRFINKLLEAFIAYDLDRKNQLGLKTVNFIDNQLLNISDSLQKAELALESYRSRNKIMDINYVSSSVMDKLDRLESDKSNLVVRLNAYQDLSEYLNSDQNYSQAVSPSVLGIDENSLLGNMLIQYSDLTRQRAGLEVSAKEGNPLLTVLDQRIKTTKEALKENLNTVIKNTQNNLSYTNRRIASLESNIIRLPQNERKLQQLERQFEFNDKIYDFLLEKRTEAAIEYATNTPDVEIVDTARMAGNGPIAPKKKFIFLLALTLGIIIPALVIAGKELTNEKIRNVDDVKKSCSIPILGEIAFSGKKGELVTYENPRSTTSESFRSLRTNLQFFHKEKSQNKVISITSSVQHEGKSFCSMNLGIVFANSGRKTLIIDTDLRNPSLNKFLKLYCKNGLSTFLSGHSDEDAIIKKLEIENLEFIPAGPIPPNPIDLLSTNRVGDLVESLKERYDHIIIDTPPIGYVSDFLLINRHSDINIFVVRANLTKKADLQMIKEMYQEKRITNLGILFNGTRPGLQYNEAPLIDKLNGKNVIPMKRIHATPRKVPVG